MNICTFPQVKVTLKTIYIFLKHLDVMFIFHTAIVLIPPNWCAKVLNSKNNWWGGARNMLGNMLLDMMK